VARNVSIVPMSSAVRSRLESWREPALGLAALLAWEKDWYAGAVAGAVTSAFLLVWWWDPTLLTFLAAMGLLLTLADYLGPKIAAQVFKADAWTGDKEKRFEQLCAELAQAGDLAGAAAAAYRGAKDARPVVHFSATVGALFALSWIGGRINNFFLLYLLALALALLPGLHKKGLLKKYFSSVVLKVNEAVKGKDAAKKIE